ncbi:MAG TPA: hypothetical protein VGH19_09020 [Verrucomicrobiae bacterium]
METKPNRTVGFLLAGLLAFTFLAALFHISDIDLGYHIRTGAYVLEHKSIPALNTFAYTTPEEPWYLHQWLPATGLYLLDKLGGVTALTTAKCLLAMMAIALTWLTARRLGSADSLWPFWFITLAVIIARPRFFERPDFLSGVIFTLLLYLDTRCGRSRRWQWLGLPALFALWANIHGGLVYGLALLFAFSVGEWAEHLLHKWRPASGQLLTLRELFVRPIGMLLAVIAAALSTQILNPHGAKILLVPFQFNNQFWQNVITELQAPPWYGNKLFYLSLPLLALLLVLSRRHWNFARFFTLCGFAILALDSQRSLLFYALATAPFAAQMAFQIRPFTLGVARPWALALLPIAWISITLLQFVPDQQYKFGYGRYPGFYPTGIFEFMEREVPAQNLFHDMRYGGPLLWQNYPKFKPFIDGRGDAYSVSFWEKEYLPAINQSSNWREIMARWKVSAILLSIPLDRQLTPLSKTLSQDPEWALVAMDDHTLLFLQRTAQNQSVISKHEFKLIHPQDWSLGNVTPENAAAAVQEATRILELSHDSILGLTAAARASLVRGDYETAAQLYSQLVEQPGANVFYWRDYGFALWQLGRLDDADAVYAHLQKKGDLAGYPAFMRHFIALKRNQREDARKYLQQAVALEPNNAEYQAASRALNGK